MDFSAIRDLEAREPAGPTSDEYTSLFARGLVHKMNNLLTVFQGYTSLLLADPDLKASTVEALKEIRKGATATSTLLDRALSVSRTVTPDLREIALPDYFDSLRAHFNKVFGDIPRLRIESPPGGRIIADSSQLRRALEPVVENALHATEKGGDILIECAPVGGERPTSHRIRVMDTGPGIEPEYLAEVWDPFFSRKKERGCMGLGLAMTRHLCKAMGARPALATESGTGTRVDIEVLAAAE